MKTAKIDHCQMCGAKAGKRHHQPSPGRRFQIVKIRFNEFACEQTQGKRSYVCQMCAAGCRAIAATPRIELVNWRKHGDEESYVKYQFTASPHYRIQNEIKDELGYEDIEKDSGDYEEAGDYEKVYYINDDLTFKDGQIYVDVATGNRYRLRFQRIRK